MTRPRAPLRMPFACALFALVVATWASALSGSFQFDDWNVIVADPRVHSLAAWWQAMPGIRPLLKFSYALSWTLSPAPTGFRIFNVACHTCSALLAAWLVAVKGRRLGLDAAAASWAGFVAAALFALHPVQSEAVTYISGRSSSLAALLCLLALYAWVRSEEARARRTGVGWLAASCILFALAVGCKETAFALPLAAWLYSADRPWRSTRARLVPLGLVACMLLAAALSLPAYRLLLRTSLDARGIGTNLLTQTHALAYLAGQLVRIEHLNADPQLPVMRHIDALSVSLAGGWVAALVIAVWNLRRRAAGAFAFAWFLMWLLPTNSVLPRLDVANDRQLYLSLLGPAAWLGWRCGPLLAGAARRLRVTRQAPAPAPAYAAVLIVSVATCTLLALLGTATVERNRIYASEIAFWLDTAARNPGSARAANNLGMAWTLACNDERAEAEFRRTLAIDPADYHARMNLALLTDRKAQANAVCTADTRQRAARVR